MLAEEGVADPARHAAGYINVSKIGNGKAEVK
jgi:hypothetical protein